MTTRASRALEGALIRPFSAAGTISAGQPIKYNDANARTVVAAGANDPDTIGIALDDAVSGMRVSAVIGGGAIVPVRVGATGATAGKYAWINAAGRLVDAPALSAAGATTTYLLGKFVESGVEHDYVGLHYQPQIAISA